MTRYIQMNMTVQCNGSTNGKSGRLKRRLIDVVTCVHS